MLPKLETERFLLRPFREEDYDELLSLNTDLRVMKYIHDNGRAEGRKEVRERLDKYLRMNSGQLGYWVIAPKGKEEFMGWACLKPLDETEKIELGYRLHERFWRKGIATEVSRRVLEYAFRDVGLGMVAGVARSENLASKVVLKKLNFAYKGIDVYYNTEVEYYELERSDYINLSST